MQKDLEEPFKTEVEKSDDFAEFHGSIHKKAFLMAYKNSFGNVSAAARMSKIDRRTFYNWRDEDNEFRTAIMNIEPEEEMLDMAEGKLYKKLVEEDMTAIIFTLKTKGQKRGFIEKQQLEISKAKPVVIDDNTTATGNENNTNSEATGSESGIEE